MSLILDALRRADAERDRERNTVPGLHAQHAPSFMLDAAPPAQGQKWLWPAAVAATGLAAALVAWLILGRQAPAPVAAAAVAGRPPASVTAASPAPAAGAAGAATAGPTAATPPAEQEDTAEPRPVAEPAPWPARSPARKAPPAEVAAAPATRPAETKAGTAAGTAVVEAPLARREQLPQDLRAQLPPLAVGGSIYSANAADRSIIIDGRILREKDRVAADLAVEQIRPKSAVLNFKGHRFEIAF